MKKIILSIVVAFMAITINAQRSADSFKNVSPEEQSRVQQNLREAVTNGAVNNRTMNAVYVGSFNVNDGPYWGTAPMVYSGLEAAALLFGGSPSDYAISTNPNTTDASTITHTAWASIYGVGGCHEVSEDYSLGDEGIYNTYGHVSAYIQDNCFDGSPSYVWRIQDSNQFITTWQTTVANESITIPTVGSGYSYSVEWGDGSVDAGITTNATHFYTTAGVYTVKISGDFPRIFFNNSGDRLKIKSIEQWGNISWSSMNGAFAGCEQLVSNAMDLPNLTAVTDMYGMFAFARKFKGDANINNWNVGNVTNMYGMFAGASEFNADINGWNVGNVTNMENMFNGASEFNKDLNSWNVENVTNMASMFLTAMKFNGAIGDWNVGNVTTMNSMFGHANNFNQAIGNWDVSNVTDMHGMFGYARMFNQEIGNWNVSNVTTMYGMFGAASLFNGNIGNWNVANVTNMENMFNGATVFNQDLGNWNVANVTNMNRMFSTAMRFNQDIGNWNVGKVIKMNSMFYHANRFDQNLGNWNVSKVNDMTNMFKNVDLSTENYDSLLMGWSALPLKNNVKFNGGKSKYCAGDLARASIISNFNWTITDGGTNCEAPETGIRQTLNDTGYTLYPNPMNNTMNVSNYSNSLVERVSIYDVMGRLIQSVDLNDIASEISIDVSSLSKATYMVVIDGQAGRTTKMMIKN